MHPAVAVAQNMESSEARIRARRLAQNEAIASRDFESVATYWTENVTVMSGLGLVFQGAENYRRAFTLDLTTVYRRLPQTIRVSQNWPIAWEQGTWTGRTDENAEPHISGSYAAYWVLRGGEWFIKSELFVAMNCAGVACTWPVVPS